MAYSSLSAVGTAVYSALNVAGLTALATGGIYDAVPQTAVLPFVWYQVEEEDIGGLGTKALNEVSLEVHSFSAYDGQAQNHAIIKKAIELLRYTTPAVTGYSTWFLVHDDTTAIPDQVINGVPCRELIARFRVYVEEP